MAQSTLTYILSHIQLNIPDQILNLAFKPRQFATTVEQRIVSEIVEGPILLDTNLVGGKRREIFLDPSWRINLPYSNDDGALMGFGVQSSFFKVPPEAREYRNISSVLGMVPNMQSGTAGSSAYNGGGNFGNTATGMMSEMINTRTMAQYPITPMITLSGTNIFQIYPDLMVDGIADSEFLNMGQSALLAMRNFALCATQKYIYNKLVVEVDAGEIVAGVELGVVKDIINDYAQKAEQYHELLMKLKGAMTYDTKLITKLAYYAL